MVKLFRSLPVLLDNFCDDLLVRSGLEKITVSGYRKTLERFFRENKRFNRKTVESYIAQMRHKEYSYSHVSNTSLALEKFSNYRRRPIKLARPRKPKQLIRDTLTEGEIARILAACKNSRERAILAVLSFTGIRNSELCNLKTKDVDIGSLVLHVVAGKGKKDGVVYFTPECGQILTEYKSEFKPNGIMFFTLVLRRHYNGSSLRKMVKVVSGRAGVKKRVYPHLFRHSMACNLLNRGANIMTIQALLRHSDIRTTMIYAHSSPQRVKQEYNFYSPSYL